ncbi:MAG: ATPase, T2SS/T4P/T4SS family, partial [Pseudomonadota bacterium]
TSLLTSLIHHLPESEHLVIIEDTHEIKTSRRFCTSFLAQEMAGFSLKDFCAYALRIRPDRIILGEMRSHEVVPFILAMNTGHRGLMSTIHADSAAQAVERVGLLFSLFAGDNLPHQLAMQLICRNINYVIHLENKKIAEIVQVLGCEEGKPLYDFVFRAS